MDNVVLLLESGKTKISLVSVYYLFAFLVNNSNFFQVAMYGEVTSRNRQAYS